MSPFHRWENGDTMQLFCQQGQIRSFSTQLTLQREKCLFYDHQSVAHIVTGKMKSSLRKASLDGEGMMGIYNLGLC